MEALSIYRGFKPGSLESVSSAEAFSVLRNAAGRPEGNGPAFALIHWGKRPFAANQLPRHQRFRWLKPNRADIDVSILQ